MKSAPIPLLLAAALVLAPAAFAAKASVAVAAKVKPRPAKPAAPVAAVEEPQPSAPLLVVQARSAAARGETQLAERLAQAAIVAAPAQTDPYLALAEIYAGAGQRDYARNYYQAALAIDPQLPAALKALAALDKNPVTAQAAQ